MYYTKVLLRLVHPKLGVRNMTYETGGYFNTVPDALEDAKNYLLCYISITNLVLSIASQLREMIAKGVKGQTFRLKSTGCHSVMEVTIYVHKVNKE